MDKKRRWITHPTGKEALLIVAVWLIATLLSLSAESNLFRENPLKHPNLILSSLNIVTSLLMLVTIINYYRNKKKSHTV